MQDKIKTVKERKQNKKRGRITVMKLYEINEGFEEHRKKQLQWVSIMKLKQQKRKSENMQCMVVRMQICSFYFKTN